MTQYFTFQNECTRKYSHLLYTKLLEIFNALPLCAVVNNQLFCVHGGISPSLKTLKDIDKVFFALPMCRLIASKSRRQVVCIAT